MNSLLLEKPKTLRWQVEQSLRDAITSGRFMPGERLIERELCALLGVSRPSLREALRKLEAEGLIRITPYKGPMIPTISADEARQIYSMRALLEGFAAFEFARLITPAKEHRLRAAVTALHDAAKVGSKNLVLESKTQFYRVLLDGCENKLAADMLLTLLFRINLLRGTSLSQSDRLIRTLAEVDEICERIYKGDAEGAQAAARLHVRNAEATAMRILEAQQHPPSRGPS